MSLIDRTLDPLPRRTPRSGRSTRCSEGWFSSPTVERARYFTDVSWARLAAPSAAGLTVLFALGLSNLDGNIAALLRICAVTLIFAGLYGPLARLTGFLRHGD